MKALGAFLRFTSLAERLLLTPVPRQVFIHTVHEQNLSVIRRWPCHVYHQQHACMFMSYQNRQFHLDSHPRHQRVMLRDLSFPQVHHLIELLQDAGRYVIAAASYRQAVAFAVPQSRLRRAVQDSWRAFLCVHGRLAVRFCSVLSASASNVSGVFLPQKGSSTHSRSSLLVIIVCHGRPFVLHLRSSPGHARSIREHWSAIGEVERWSS